MLEREPQRADGLGERRVRRLGQERVVARVRVIGAQPLDDGARDALEPPRELAVARRADDVARGAARVPACAP